MRTTLTLDDDLAARLKDLCRKSGTSFRDAVNDAIRRGLEVRSAPAQRFRVQARDLGLRPGLQLDNIGELLEQIEGPTHK